MFSFGISSDGLDADSSSPVALSLIAVARPYLRTVVKTRAKIEPCSGRGWGAIGLKQHGRTEAALNRRLVPLRGHTHSLAPSLQQRGASDQKQRHPANLSFFVFVKLCCQTLLNDSRCSRSLCRRSQVFRHKNIVMKNTRDDDCGQLERKYDNTFVQWPVLTYSILSAITFESLWSCERFTRSA